MFSKFTTEGRELTKGASSRTSVPDETQGKRMLSMSLILCFIYLDCERTIWFSIKVASHRQRSGKHTTSLNFVTSKPTWQRHHKRRQYKYSSRKLAIITLTDSLTTVCFLFVVGVIILITEIVITVTVNSLQACWWSSFFSSQLTPIRSLTV